MKTNNTEKVTVENYEKTKKCKVDEYYCPNCGEIDFVCKNATRKNFNEHIIKKVFYCNYEKENHLCPKCHKKLT